MKIHVLFIQGAGEGAYQEDEKLVASLRHRLGASYLVHYPAMQNEDDADYATWVRQIEGELAVLNGAVVLVGHSVGASVLIKYLSENKVKNKIAGVFLIAAPFWGGESGWTYDGYETLALPNEANMKFPEGVPVFLYHSHDDEIVPFAHMALFAERFPMATVRELDERGHQLKDDLSEVADDIKSIS